MATVLLTCPDCKSTNVIQSDDEPRLYDCRECGIWFPVGDGVGLRSVDVCAADGTLVVVWVERDSPLLDGSWSIHRNAGGK